MTNRYCSALRSASGKIVRRMAAITDPVILPIPPRTTITMNWIERMKEKSTGWIKVIWWA